jgi:hypothetical protein
MSTSNANKECLATLKPAHVRIVRCGAAAVFVIPVCLVPALGARRLFTAQCGLDRVVIWAAKDINQTSRSLISDRFYTRESGFYMLEQQKCRNYG